MKIIAKWALFLTLFVYGAASAATEKTTVSPNVITKFLQFVLKADTGTVKVLDGNKGIYQLDLQGVDENVLYFTNRPRRIVDNMTTRFFLKRWIKPPPRDFVSEPPNAAIIYANAGNQQGLTIVKLMNPVYDASQQTLQFTIQTTAGEKLSLPSSLEKPIITMGEITVCGVLGAWGDLPGEPKSDIECHKAGG